MTSDVTIQLRAVVRAAIFAGVLNVLVGFCTVVHAQSPSAQVSKVFLDMSLDAESRLIPTSDQVSVDHSRSPEAPGIVVICRPGRDAYPGVNIKPMGQGWDLSAFGHVEARVVNVGAKPLSISLRVDNAGDWKDNPWNTETVTLEPGKSGTVRTIFGYA